MVVTVLERRGESLGAALLIGPAARLYPALRASRLPPTEALTAL